MRPLLLVFEFFCLVETLLFDGEVWLLGICVLGRPVILDPVGCESLMGIWFWRLRWIFVAVVEHKFVPVRSGQTS